MGKLSALPTETSFTLSDFLVKIKAAGAGDVKVTYQNLITFLGVNNYNGLKFRAYRNAAASTGNGAFAVVATDTEQFDTGNNLASGVFTAPIAGFYFFTGQISVSAGGANSDTTVALFKNGTETSQGVQQFGTAGTTTGCTVSDLIQMAPTDTVDLRAYAAVTKSLNVGVTYQNYFAGYLLSAT